MEKKHEKSAQKGTRMETKGEKQPYTGLSTEYNHLHSRMLEEFPEGPYGSADEDAFLGKQSGWDSGEEVAPRFSYENEELHEDAQRLYPQRDPMPKNPRGKIK